MNNLPAVKESNYLEPSSFSEAMEFSKMLAASDFAPKDYKGKPGNVMIAMQMGYEVGLKPMQAIQNIAVINGRPSVWGDALLAIVQSSGKLKYIKEWHEGDVSYCETQRDGYPEPYRNSFSDTDAKAAGLLSKPGSWQTNKVRMRQMRARGFNLRDQFADVLKGLNAADEIDDYPVNITSEDKAVKSPIQLPKRKSEVPGKGLLNIGDEYPSAVEFFNTVTGEIEKQKLGPVGALAPGTIIEDPFMHSVKEIQQERTELISEAQQKRLFAIAQNKVSTEELKAHLLEWGYKSSREIRKVDYEQICNWIEKIGSKTSDDFNEVEG